MNRQKPCTCRAFLLDGVRKMSDILYDAAAAFDAVSKYTYELHLGNKKRKVVISLLSSNESDFTHIVGLDHLKDIPAVTAKYIPQRIAVYRKILAKTITFSTIEPSQELFKAMSGSINPVTGREYCIYDRIALFSTFEALMDQAHTGKLYRWNLKNAKAAGTGQLTRFSNINLDYVLAIPIDKANHVSVYIFMYQTNKNADVAEPIKLNVRSVFADTTNLTAGQALPYTILQESKIRNADKSAVILYRHHSYQPEAPK